MAKKKRKRRQTTVGLSVANPVGPVLIRNPTTRLRKRGDLIPKTRQP